MELSPTRQAHRASTYGRAGPGVHVHGIIPAARAGTAPVPPIEFPHGEGDPLFRSVRLWNAQQAFDERLHVERRVPLPRDDPQNGDLMRSWICGMAFAFLEELDELREALVADNPDEETVDTLHFVLSLAEKLGLTPATLGRFEDRFEAARADAEDRGHADWRAAYHAVLPEYVHAIADLKGSHHKWWKNQPFDVDRDPPVAALRRIDHLNLLIASRVFRSAEAMYDRYMSKVEENHARQRGEVAERADYTAV